ncbi:uncharacterized protein B0H18DRAFT_160212 [Fomitopsis serialis]|uniref:uncharacterized protein n=1 Tax=Fomitopsis serialis TaxID=139415 RepID=UPI002007F490|nr:uncharacterized protein B0H18DRAFT_160212 [Neoantrodia serialis]KAH9930055.1 hypothetical protein B0H18DRAFT_160212 [Neoantrodia serialis]
MCSASFSILRRIGRRASLSIRRGRRRGTSTNAQPRAGRPTNTSELASSDIDSVACQVEAGMQSRLKDGRNWNGCRLRSDIGHRGRRAPSRGVGGPAAGPSSRGHGDAERRGSGDRVSGLSGTSGRLRGYTHGSLERVEGRLTKSRLAEGRLAERGLRLHTGSSAWRAGVGRLAAPGVVPRSCAGLGTRAALANDVPTITKLRINVDLLEGCHRHGESCGLTEGLTKGWSRCSVQGQCSVQGSVLFVRTTLVIHLVGGGASLHGSKTLALCLVGTLVALALAFIA